MNYLNDSRDLTNKITVVVFKGNDVARTFLLPLNWISKLGFLVWLVAAISATSIFFAVKYYRATLRTDSFRVQELETELASLRNSYAALESKLAAKSSQYQAELDPQATDEPKQIEPVSEDVVASSSQLATGQLPSITVTNASPEATPEAIAAMPIKLHAPSITWRGKTLRISFSIQYVRNDKRSQQGRILVLARGPDTLLAYPKGAFNPAGASVLINPKQGEYFSVSRFREVRAEFGPLPSHESLREVEILILNQTGESLIHEKIAIPAQQPGVQP